MNDSNATEPSTTPISQGSDADGPFSYGPVATPVVSYAESSSASGGNTMVYFFLCWIVLLTLIVALVYVLVECRCRRNQKQRQLQSLPETHDVEVAEPVVAVESRSRKMNYHIGLAILFVGSLFGLGLSIFSIATCEFAAINESVRLDVDQLSITIYNLGLWKVDVTSNSALSGCVSTDNLPFLDAPYAFAKASAIIAVMFGGIGPLILMCLLTKPGFVGIKVRYLLVCLYVLASLFQLTTLTLFGSMYCNSSLFEESENNCRSGIGSVASVSAALFWMLEVVAVSCLPF